MVLASRAFALVGGIALALSGVAASSAAATTSVFPLRGTQMAAMAHGIASVTQVSPGDYKVAITISAMPVPSTLHTTPIRHAYVAFAFDPSRMHLPAKGSRPASPMTTFGSLVAIPLHATGAHTYTGTGTLMMTKTPGIIVTAEVSAMTHTPAMPFWGVLFGTMQHQ